ncbi:hypothetical protein LEP1GSC170_0925 [Leptospira interrogans serovar Bataviae str. HAI135]|nr:hypothetical protein LEP1GSC170_0925 [Leptospira interrogans serovar Bataviae str. HAI135]EMO41634.1 hypothetical protein LEP1GSC186_1744 [Leptospira noguchii serovar Autumnalis str. ZUN142]
MEKIKIYLKNILSLLKISILRWLLKRIFERLIPIRVV